MTPAEFLQPIEEVLRQRRVSFSRAAAIVFVESCWPLIEDDPDPWRWPECFIEAVASAVEAGDSSCPSTSKC
jgi:hypothetical protein